MNSKTPDFWIYASNEIQIETFKKLTMLCDQINVWKNVNAFHIEQAFNNKVMSSENVFIPNPNYIKSL